MPGGRRVGWIDWARALGACSIVLLHVMVSTARAVDVGLARSVGYATVGIALCRWAVPGFFMMSGLLLLDPSRAVTKSDVCRHVRRMAMTLATFGLVFALMEELWLALRTDGSSLGLSLVPRALWDVLTTQTWDHLWYVYAMLGIYLLLPVVRMAYERLGEHGFVWATVWLYVVALVLPTLNEALAAKGMPHVALPQSLLATYVRNLIAGLTCFCVGGCLRTRTLTPLWVVVGTSSLALMLVVSLTGVFHGEGDQGYVFLQGSFLACLYAAFVLLVLRRLVGERPVPHGSAIALLARDSFGIYVIHPLFVHVLLMVVSPRAIPPLLFEAALFAMVLAASLATTKLCRGIPLLRGVL